MPLHIGADADKVVVSPSPLSMRTGRGRRRRYGSVVELVPVPPTGRDRTERTRRSARIALVLIFLCAVLDALGIPWWAAAAGSAGLLTFVIREQARAARPGIIAVPAGDDTRVLVARAERAAYERALAAAHRVRRTWPELGRLIDPADADRTLSRALDELAGLLVRRQRLRRLRDELSGVRPGDLPPDSPALVALAAQRARVEDLWRSTGAQANRTLRGIEAAARAGESLIREHRIHDTARRAEATLAQLSTGGPPPATEAAPELAQRTAAVVRAYRELRMP